MGIATVGIFIYWYCFYDWAGDGHTLVKFSQLSNWAECGKDWVGFKVANYGDYTDFHRNPCDYFTYGKQKASTLSLTVLVMIEMFNALNALSEDSSLFTIGIFANPFLLVAIAMSILLHCAIIYIPFLSNIFGTDPLTKNDWILVLLFSLPVIPIDECLKFISRQRIKAAALKNKKDI